MALFYKHDIAAWMDGTEHLDDGCYRVYHVICQLIYLNEGPIRVNENGIAGRCHQSVRSFRVNLAKLLELGLISTSEGRLSNSRAEKELEKIGENRLNAAKGGKARHKPLENNTPVQAPLLEQPALRLEETRQEETIKKKDAADAPLDVRFYRRAKEILGDRRGGQYATRILKAYDRNYSEGMILLERASGKEDPIPYIEKTLKNLHDPATGIHPGL